MKIAVISTPIFALGPMGLAGYGGLEQVAWQVAKGLAARGHEVSLFAPDGSSCPGASIVPLGPPGQVSEKTAYSRYWELLPSFDVVIDHSWQKWSYLLKKEGKLKAPILGVLHAPVDTMYRTLPPGVEKHCFVCISQDQALHFQALFGREARVAYNGIDLNFYKPIKAPRTGRFLFLARFSTIKGPDLAIDACRQVGAGLDLVGDTSITQEPEFLEKCRKLTDGKQINFVGPANRGETVWWFSQAHCLLHPNQRFREPFGLAPLEAMACGCPVIAWAHGAMKETVVHGETGFLVRSMDELVGYVKACLPNGSGIGRIDLDKMRVRCRDWVAQFSEEKSVLRYEELCKEALDTGGW